MTMQAEQAEQAGTQKPVAWLCRQSPYVAVHRKGIHHDGDIPLYAEPNERIARLEAETARLRERNEKLEALAQAVRAQRDTRRQSDQTDTEYVEALTEAAARTLAALSALEGFAQERTR